MRVVDVFDESFLLERPAVLSDQPPLENLFEEDFEAGLTGLSSYWGTPDDSVTDHPNVDIREDVHGRGLSLTVGSAEAARLPRISRQVFAWPSTTYRLQAAIRTDDLTPLTSESTGATLMVTEIGVEEQTITAHRHLDRERGTSSGWQTLDYSFRTSSGTDRLQIDLVASAGPAQGWAFFDDIRLKKIPPTAAALERDIFFSRTRKIAPHPLVKRLTLKNDERPAIFAPVPTRWALRVRPSEDTSLHFSLGTAAYDNPHPSQDSQGLGVQSSQPCFEVRWRSSEMADGRSKLLYDDCAERPRSWQDVTLDLGELAGQTGELQFATTGPLGRPAFWGNPRLVARDRKPGDQRPNVVLIVVDTLRADRLGSAGYGRPTSPALDRFAQRAVQFRRAYASSPWTAPSLSSLMTGLYPEQHQGGIRVNREQATPGVGNPRQRPRSSLESRLLGERFRQATALRYHPIGRHTTTLAEELRSAGYETFGLHSNYNSSGVLGLSRGFDRYQMFSGVSREGALTGVLKALSFLEKRREANEAGPFLLLLHTQDPHIPYRLRREMADAFEPAAFTEAPPTADPENADPGNPFRRVGDWAVEFWDWQGLRAGHWQGNHRVEDFYDAEIAWADRALGRLLEELKAWPQTVTVVTADHGEEFGEHGQFEHGHSLYNEVLRVPFLIALPGGEKAGEIVDEPVSLVDLRPTLLDLALGRESGVDNPGTEGRSLFRDGTVRSRPGVFAEAMLRGPERTAIISGPLKYIFIHPPGYLSPFSKSLPRQEVGPPNDAQEELYNVVDDPGETANLVSERPDEAAPLRDAVFSYLQENAHGVHFRCRGEKGLHLQIDSSVTFGHVKPMTVEESDIFQVEASRRSMTWTSAADESDDWWILRLTEPAGEITVQSTERIRFYADSQEGVSGLRLRLGDARSHEKLAMPPEPLSEPGPWCQVWEVVGATASDQALGDEVAAQLRALGYLE